MDSTSSSTRAGWRRLQPSSKATSHARGRACRAQAGITIGWRRRLPPSVGRSKTCMSATGFHCPLCQPSRCQCWWPPRHKPRARRAGFWRRRSSATAGLATRARMSSAAEASRRLTAPGSSSWTNGGSPTRSRRSCCCADERGSARAASAPRRSVRCRTLSHALQPCSQPRHSSSRSGGSRPRLPRCQPRQPRGGRRQASRDGRARRSFAAACGPSRGEREAAVGWTRRWAEGFPSWRRTSRCRRCGATGRRAARLAPRATASSTFPRLLRMASWREAAGSRQCCTGSASAGISRIDGCERVFSVLF
mmetsp:Transcript_21436/g.63464  ORF Transcript_21436/g.63464 Transcript_21436/m.63464 type:complete len:307 (-) Transcript_21436:88-1008(-)